MSRPWRNTSLILAGHGSLVCPHAGKPLHQHADRLRARGEFGQVLVGFWKQEPSLPATLRAAALPSVIVVPFLFSEGYFSEQVFPREFGLLPADAPAPGFPATLIPRQRPLHYTKPAGTHPAVAALIAEIALHDLHPPDSTGQHPVPRPPPASDVTLVIAAHGSSLHPGSRTAAETHALHLRQLGRFRDVQTAYLEEAPYIREAPAQAATEHMVVVPFFASDGPHSRSDLPSELGLERFPESGAEGGVAPGRTLAGRHAGRWIWLAPTVGPHPRMTDMILARVRELDPAISACAP